MKPNLTTESLTELQRSITQGEWEAVPNGGDDPCPDRVYVVTNAKRASTMVADASCCETEEAEANARAIALVPELIAEVIKLRKVLSEFVTDVECAGAEDWPDIGITAEKARAVLAGK